MIFWILLGAAVAVVALVFVRVVRDDGWGFAALVSIVAAMLSALVGGGLLALSLLIPGTVVREQTHPLRAIGDSSSIEGRFYLGSGYIGGSRQLNYIKQGDGYSMVASAPGESSRVFEGSSGPSVIEYEHVYSNAWVIPWEFRIGWTYDFHVPAGSILEDYSITNQ